MTWDWDIEPYKPLSRVLYSDMVAAGCPVPSIAARGYMRAAAISKRGVKCISCGTVVKQVAPDKYWLSVWEATEYGVLELFVVLTCCELCHVRINHEGICIDDI